MRRTYRRLVVAGVLNIHYSNGMAVTRDGRHLLVSEMLENRVLRYDIGPDGLVYVAENGTGRVVVLDQAGHYVRSVKVPARYVTNVALAPWGEMYVTAAFDANNPPYPGAGYAAW